MSHVVVEIDELISVAAGYRKGTREGGQESESCRYSEAALDGCVAVILVKEGRDGRAEAWTD